MRLIKTAEGSSRPKVIRVGPAKVPNIEVQDFAAVENDRRNSTGAKNPARKYKVDTTKANTDRYYSQVRNGHNRNPRRSYPLNLDIDRFGKSGGESSPGEYRKITDINMFGQQTSFLENSIDDADGMNRKTSRVFAQRRQDPRKKVQPLFFQM